MKTGFRDQVVFRSSSGENCVSPSISLVRFTRGRGFFSSVVGI